MIDWDALGSIGTFLAFVVAFVAIAIERWDRYRARQREQAERISAWIDPEQADCGTPRSTAAVVSNASGEPVFRAIVWLVRLQGGGGPATGEAMARWLHDSREVSPDNWATDGPALLNVLPPGRFVTCLANWEGGMHAAPGVEVAFTDAAGRNWIRRAEGRLERIAKEPAPHYGIELPQDWSSPLMDRG